MMLSRRRFLAQNSLLALAAILPSAKSKSYRMGYSAITWGGKDELAIEELAGLGYQGIQLRANTYAKYKDKGFEIFGVSLDKDKAAWIRAIENDRLVWKHVSDLQYWNSVGAQAYGVNSIPMTFLLDPAGKIVAKGLRGPALEQYLENIFKDK